MKKILAVLAALLMLACTAFAEGGSCGTGLSWQLEGGTLTVSGTGAMADFNWYDGVPWEYSRGSITKVVVGSGVTHIGNITFASCLNLVDVTLPEGLLSIGTSAFDSCAALKEIELPSTLTSIGEIAFAGSGLTGIVLPSSLAQIDRAAFENCGSLSSAAFSPGFAMEALPNSLFLGCGALTEVAVPDGVKTIGETVFCRCGSLERISLPASLTRVEVSAFEDCSALQYVFFGGTDAQYGAITMQTGNNPLRNALWWQMPEYEWANDYSQVSVTCACLSEDRTASETADAVADIRSPTGSEAGAAVYVVAFENPLFGMQKYTVPIPALSEMDVLILPEGLETVGEDAFRGAACEAVLIPPGCESVGAGAFAECGNIVYVRLPAGLLLLEGAFPERPIVYDRFGE